MGSKLNEKKGSLEVSVNFIIVMIVCVLLLMMGLLIMSRGEDAFKKEYNKVKEIQESQLREALSKSGQPVLVYPSNIQLTRGEGFIFSLGVTNQLGADQNFVVYVVEGAVSNPNNKILYNRNNPPLKVRNTETGFVPIKITSAKDQGKISYTFNICVYPESADPGAGCPAEGRYGDVQKIITNIR